MSTPNHSTPRPGFGDPIAGVRLWPLPFLVFVVSALALLPFGRPSAESELQTRVVVAATWATVVVWWWWTVGGASRRAGLRAPAIDLGATLKVALRVALGLLSAKLLWGLLADALSLPALGVVTAPRLLSSDRTTQSVVVAVLLMAVLGPVGEELLFRGALFRKWRLKLGPGKAAILTSALFGLAHTHAHIAGVVALSMAVLYTTTRTIWAPIIAHSMGNLSIVVVSQSPRLLPPWAWEAVTSWPARVVLLIVGLMGSIVLFSFLRRGWHTLGDPVDGVVDERARVAPPAGAPDISRSAVEANVS